MARPKGSKNVKTKASKAEKAEVTVEEAQIEDDPLLVGKSLFRVDEAATYFDVSVRTIYLWVDHGILAAEKYRGTIRISRASILGCRFKARFDPML